MNKPIANKLLDNINECLELIRCTCSSSKNHDNGFQVFKTYSACPKCIILRDLLPKLGNEVKTIMDKSISCQKELNRMNDNWYDKGYCLPPCECSNIEDYGEYEAYGERCPNHDKYFDTTEKDNKNE